MKNSDIAIAVSPMNPILRKNLEVSFFESCPTLYSNKISGVTTNAKKNAILSSVSPWSIAKSGMYVYNNTHHAERLPRSKYACLAVLFLK